MTGLFKLVIADDEGKTTVVPLVRDEVTIGRKDGNTIRLTERNVSRRHAKLRKANGSYVVEDLSSYNGVKVNGRRIGGETALKAGDQIAIGDYQIALQLEDAGQTLPDASAVTVTVPVNIAPEISSKAASAQEPPEESALSEAPTQVSSVPIPRPTSSVPSPGTHPMPPARLVMVSLPTPGAEFALVKSPLRIGRAEELDIWVNHRSISREHAEITVDGKGAVRVRDLGSANGVRINGRDVTKAELKPGDTLELGQVRMRMVGAGEVFVFDAAATMQFEGIPQEAASNKTPLMVAGAILGAALIGAVAVALSGRDDPPVATATPITELTTPAPHASVTVTQTVPVETASAEVEAPVVPPIAPSLTQEEQLAAREAACRAAIGLGDFAGAIAQAEAALRLDPSNRANLDCRSAAQQTHTDAIRFAEGYRLYTAEDYEGAHTQFDGLPAQSPYRRRPEVADAARRHAVFVVETATQIERTDPDRALQLASSALELESVLNRSQLVAARQIVSRIEGGSARRATAATPRTRHRAEPPVTHVEAPPPTVPQTPVVVRNDPPPSTANPPAESPLVIAQQCLAHGDNQCVIRALDGRARTPQEMRLLVETYRAMGNSARMLDTMESFIRRFPTDPRAQQYRQILAQQGR